METQEADGERVVSEFVVVTPLQDRTDTLGFGPDERGRTRPAAHVPRGETGKGEPFGINPTA